MSIHDIIHTDSSVVTAWLSKHGVRLLLIALAAGAMTAAFNVWNGVRQADWEADIATRVHQGLVPH